MAKTKFIQAVGYALVGSAGAPSTPLSPGERLRFIEDDATHKEVAAEIEDGRNTVLQIVEVDLAAESKADEERKELLAKAEKIAAQQRTEEVRSQQRAAGEGLYDPTENSVKDVLAYLDGATPEEVARVKSLEADSRRSSKMVADFEGTGGSGPDTGNTEGSPGTSPGQDSSQPDNSANQQQSGEGQPITGSGAGA